MKDLKHFDTFVYKQVLKSANIARQNKVCVLIQGDTGIGKTYAVESIKNKEGVFLFHCDSDYNPREFIKRIAVLVGASDRGSKATVREAVQEKLKEIVSTGVTPLLIIDEAENLQNSVYDVIKSLMDVLLDRSKLCGMVIVGATGFVNKIEKLALAQKKNFPQIHDRFKANILKEKLSVSAAEIEGLCKTMGIADVELINVLSCYTSLRQLRDVLLLMSETCEKYQREMVLSTYFSVTGEDIKSKAGVIGLSADKKVRQSTKN